ncbi:MAG: hypothetical protein ACYDEJ_17205 [Desulfitobacteriaceae bacterium]
MRVIGSVLAFLIDLSKSLGGIVMFLGVGVMVYKLVTMNRLERALITEKSKFYLHLTYISGISILYLIWYLNSMWSTVATEVYVAQRLLLIGGIVAVGLGLNTYIFIRIFISPFLTTKYTFFVYLDKNGEVCELSDENKWVIEKVTDTKKVLLSQKGQSRHRILALEKVYQSEISSQLEMSPMDKWLRRVLNKIGFARVGMREQTSDSPVE